MAEPASKSRMVLAEETMAEPASKSRMVLTEEGCSYFPEEILDCIFKSLNGHRRTFKSLSVVSKQFLAITNRLRSSVKITDQTIPYLDRLFQRFPNLTSLKITIQSKTIEELDDILTLISTFPLHKVKSLNLSTRPIHIHSNGLIALAKTMKNLKSLTCYKMVNVEKNDLFFIAGCFPLLEELNLSYPRFRCSRDFEVDDNGPLLALPNLRKINLSGNHIGDQFVNFLHHSCKLLRVVILKKRSTGTLGNPKYDRSDIIYF